MSFEAGDRVRWNCTGDDGLPLIRYGFVGGGDTGVGGGDEAPVVTVMLDGQFSTDVTVPVHELEPVTIASIELRLAGGDLLDDPTLRQGLVSLWFAEIDQAGIQVRSIERFGSGIASSSGFDLAALRSGGVEYTLHATADIASDTVWVRVVER